MFSFSLTLKGEQMTATEAAWGHEYSKLSCLLQIQFLIQENAYFRWEERMKKGIHGSRQDDWYWAEEYVHQNWPFEVIRALYMPIAMQNTSTSQDHELTIDWGDPFDYSDPEDNEEGEED
jgi:hypothetical protein